MSKTRVFLQESAGRIMFICLLCICFFGNNIFISFATDTYATFHNFYNISEWMIQGNARILIGIVYKIWILTGIQDEVFYYISHIIAMLLLITTVFILQHILRDKMTNDFFRISVCFFTIANVFIIEYFMFIEKCMFLFAVFLNIVALSCMIMYFRKKKVQYYLAAFGCMLGSVFTYQGTVGLFVVLSLPFAFQYADNLKSYIKNMFLVMLNYGMVCILNVVTAVAIVKSSRIQNNSNLLDQVIETCKGIANTTIYSFSIIPKYMFMALFGVILGTCIVIIFVEYQGIDRMLQIGNLLMIFLVTIVVSTAPIILGSGWFAPRIIYPYASILGIYVIHMYVNIWDGDCKKIQLKKYATALVYICIILFLFIEYLFFCRIVKDKYINNYMDRYRCKIIGENIKEYEANTGMEIRYIDIYRDSQPDLQYDNLFHEGDLVVSAFTTNWSDVAMINYYLGKSYMKGEPEPYYQAYFGEKNWNVFSNEQIVFDGDTLHLCIY